MRKNYFALFFNVVVIAALTFVVIACGIKESFVFTDKGNNTIDIYSGGNVTITAIEGIETKGKPIRVQTEVPYNGVILSYNNDPIEMDEGFTFFNDVNQHQSMQINFDAYSEQLYLERDYFYLQGFVSVSLASIIAIVFLVLDSVMLVLTGKEKIDREAEIVRVGMVTHIYNILKRIKLGVLATLGLLMFFIFIFDSNLELVGLISDGAIIGVSLLVIAMISIGSVIHEKLKNDLVFDFSNQRLRVSRGSQVLYDEAIDELVYQESLIIKNNSYQKDDYMQMDLYLSRKSQTGGVVKISLIPFGTEGYQAIMHKLKNRSQGPVFDQVILEKRERQEFNMQGRDISKQNMFFGFAAIFMIIAFFIPLFLPRSMQAMAFFVYIGLFALIFIVLCIYIFRTQRLSAVTIRLSEQSISINDELISLDMIESISMTHPKVAATFPKTLEIKLKKGKRKWIFSARRGRHTNELEEIEYHSFYTIVSDRYADKFKLS